MSVHDLVVAQALADVATIAIVQNRVANEAQTVTEQLNRALNSRVVIEQAKGMLAERAAVNMDEAFSALRGYARTAKRRLSDVSGEVVSGALPADQVLSASHAGGARGSVGRRAG